jgi:hypothetical protein
MNETLAAIAVITVGILVGITAISKWIASIL